MLRVFIMAFPMGLFSLMAGAFLVYGTNIFRGLNNQGESFAVLLIVLAGVIVGAIAGATDAIIWAIKGHLPQPRIEESHRVPT